MILRSTFLVFLLTSSQLVSANISLKQESECLAKIVYAEARGEPPQGQVAVAHTVRTRLKTGLGKTACGISRSGAYVARSIPASSRTKYVTLALGVLSGKIPDNTHGAAYFCRKDMKRKPRWYRVGQVTVNYGKHAFVRLG